MTPSAEKTATPNASATTTPSEAATPPVTLALAGVSPRTPLGADLPAPVQTFLLKNPRFRAPVLFVWTFAMNWINHQCSLIAGAMAYFGLLSIFPIALAAVTILAGALRGSPQLLQSFSSFVEQFFPGQSGSELSRSLTAATAKLSQARSGTLNLLAIGALLWSGRAYFDTLAGVLNTIFPRTLPRSFLGHQLAVWSTFLGAGALFVLSTLAGVVFSMLQAFWDKSPFQISEPEMLWKTIAQIASLGFTLLMFWLMFRFLPNVQGRKRGRLALIAALFSSVAWELAKLAFARLLPGVTRYEPTYGSIAGVVVTMLWIYFASLITLAGAEFAGAWEAVRDERQLQIVD